MGPYLATAFFSFVGGLVFVGVIAALTKRRQPPKLAGAIIPELGEGLDTSKRYDVVYSGDYGASFTERLEAVKIIGYVGKDDDESVGKMYMRSRWLVVEFADGRKAYLMPRAILSLQESTIRS